MFFLQLSNFCTAEANNTSINVTSKLTGSECLFPLIFIARIVAYDTLYYITSLSNRC